MNRNDPQSESVRETVTLGPGANGETSFEDLARIAAELCGAPAAIVCLVDADGNWTDAGVGVEVSQELRSLSLEAVEASQGAVLENFDITADQRFSQEAAAVVHQGLQFLACAPVDIAVAGKAGALCVLDRAPRSLTDAQRIALKALSRQTAQMIKTREELEERRKIDQRHAFILDSAVDYAIVSMKLDGTVTSWNEGARRVMGWTEDEMCGSPCHRFFTPEDRDEGVPEKEMGSALANGRGKDERWHLRSDGSRFWANGEMMPLTDEADRPIGFIKILRDRTEQRLEYERLKAVEERYRVALDAAGFVGSWDWDIQSDTLRADAGFCEFFSVDPREGEAGAPLTTFTASIHPDDRARVEERIRRCVEDTGEFAEEYRLTRRDGSVRWVTARGRCFRDDEGAPKHFPGVAVDTTERKQAELAREESETRMRLALQAGDLGTWDLVPEVGATHFDTRARDLLQQSSEEPSGFEDAFISHVHPDDRSRVRTALRNAIDKDAALDTEFRVVGGDERLRHVHALGAVFVDAPKRFLGTLRDVTEARRAEEHRALLTHELQHRIKNTLSVVQAIVSQSLRNASTPSEARDTIGNRLQVLSEAHDLLTRASWTAAPIDAVVDGAIQLQGGRSGRIHAEGPDVRLNARAALAMAMALHELGTNAVKYGALSMPEGHIDLRWWTGPTDTFGMTWIEVGGPAVTPPAKVGFGTRLMQNLGRDLGGKATIDYDPAGVRWTLHSSLTAITEHATPLIGT